MTLRRRRFAWALLAVCAAGGCRSAAPAVPSAPVPPKRDAEPVGLQLLRGEPELRDEKFLDLLSFEQPTDAVFAKADVPVSLSPEAVHTGTGALRVPAGASQVTFPIAALLGSGAFPADWTLLGGYVRSPRACRVTAEYVEGGAVLARSAVDVPADAWTAVRVDLTSVTPPAAATAPATGPTSAPQSSPGNLVYRFGVSAGVWIDDVMLIDNDATLVDTTDGTMADRWVVRRRGHTLSIKAGAASEAASPAPPSSGPARTLRFSLVGGSPDGWALDEYGPLRVRLSRHAPGRPADLTLYADGREYADGALTSAAWSSSGAGWIDAGRAAHLRPAKIDVDDALGRVDRNTPGDANNDGYNERRGAYELVASGRHLEVRVTPGEAELVRPVFEVRGLPDGKLLATLEGQLVPDCVRLPDGRVLIELRTTVSRRAVLDVRAE